jgi:glycosyltransferase involved in cell wall biosynthesis
VLLRLRKHVQTLSDPLLLVNGEVAELFTAFFVGRPRIICVEHASQPWKMNRALGLVVRLVLKRKHVRWVTVNSQQRQIWPSIQTFVCIPNPVVPTDPSTADSDLGLIHIGRITKEKGVHLACKASVATKITLDIFGDGELSQDLKEEFARETNIKFHGFVEEVWASIGPNRVLLACSYHEGDGRNIAEAIMRRQPILLLDTNDHRRFGLPDENYFTSLDVLIGKLSLHQASSFNEIRPSLELAKAEREKRDPTRVGRLWVDVLLANGRH